MCFQELVGRCNDATLFRADAFDFDAMVMMIVVRIDVVQLMRGSGYRSFVVIMSSSMAGEDGGDEQCC